jgi:F-type H+-transporting ATPase subunit b
MHLDGWTIALQTANFAVLVWLLHRFLYKPVLAVIDTRRDEIQQRYDAVKAAEEQAQARLAAIETERAGIVAERDAALKTAAAQAQAAADERHARAEREAQALLDAARDTLAAERERALEEARRIAFDLATALAQRLLAEVPVQFRAEAWIERIEQHLQMLPASELAALRDGALTVVTAAPLPEGTAKAWRKRLCHLLGDGIATEFAVNPELVAGAELHFPTAILRFSWQSTLAAMRSEVAAHADAH